MIEVRLYANLPAHARSRARRIEIAYRPGLTVGDVVSGEQLSVDDVRIILLNGVHGSLSSELHEGDRLALFPALGGG